MTQEFKCAITVDTTDFESKADAFETAIQTATNSISAMSAALTDLKTAYVNLKISTEVEPEA